MEKIKWCLSIKKGIELIEPNKNLGTIYLRKSENALKAVLVLKDNKEWEISSCYYAMYFALYSILMRAGVKCENHSCTIEFMKVFLKEYFNKKEVSLIKNAMKSRIDVQYYTDGKVSEAQYRSMIGAAPSFLVKCKEVLLKVSEEEIEEIREQIRNL